jgi:hypothetical protein
MSSEVPWFWLAAVFGIGIFEADNIYRGWKKQDVYTKGISELKVGTVHISCSTYTLCKCAVSLLTGLTKC